MKAMGEWNLIVRSEVLIEASPSEVWELVDRLQEWKESIASLECLEGAAGQEGAVLRIGQRSGDQISYLILKTLRRRRPEWTVFEVTVENSPATQGYFVYSLYERGSQTLLVNDLLVRYGDSVADLHCSSIEAATRVMQEATQTKLDNDNRKLKRLVEQRQSTSRNK